MYLFCRGSKTHEKYSTSLNFLARLFHRKLSLLVFKELRISHKIWQENRGVHLLIGGLDNCWVATYAKGKECLSNLFPYPWTQFRLSLTSSCPQHFKKQMPSLQRDYLYLVSPSFPYSVTIPWGLTHHEHRNIGCQILCLKLISWDFMQCIFLFFTSYRRFHRRKLKECYLSSHNVHRLRASSGP